MNLNQALTDGNLQLVQQLVATAVMHDASFEALESWPIAMITEYNGAEPTGGELFVTSGVVNANGEAVAVTMSSAEWLAIIVENVDELNAVL